MASSLDSVALHHRLLRGDRLAVDELVSAYLPVLIRSLRTRQSDLSHDAAMDALLDYWQRPATFDPVKGSLPSFLCLAAKRNLMNAVVGESRRKRRETEAARSAKNRVELSPAARNDCGSDEDHDKQVYRLLATLAPADRPVGELILGGERSTAAFAKAMGLTTPLGPEQALAIKRAKGRVKATWKRLMQE